MARYLVRRLAFLIVTLLITSFAIFAITQLLPGDIARISLGREAGEAALRSLRVELGLDRPPLVQYLSWLRGFVSGDWGASFATGQQIRPLVMERLVNTLMLAGLTFLFAVPAALALGTLAALNRDRAIDGLISVASLAVVGLPEFVTGLVLIQVFAFRFRLLPANSSIELGAGFLEALPMLVLPAVTGTLVMLAYIARLTRASVIQELDKPYVRTARLKGLRLRTVLFGHVLGNALLPTITVIAISVGWLISGMIVIENVFNYPGLGSLLTFAVDRQDVPLLQAITVVAVLAFSLANLLADLLSAYLNPRIRLS